MIRESFAAYVELWFILFCIKEIAEVLLDALALHHRSANAAESLVEIPPS